MRKPEHFTIIRRLVAPVAKKTTTGDTLGSRGKKPSRNEKSKSTDHDLIQYFTGVAILLTVREPLKQKNFLTFHIILV